MSPQKCHLVFLPQLLRVLFLHLQYSPLLCCVLGIVQLLTRHTQFVEIQKHTTTMGGAVRGKVVHKVTPMHKHAHLHLHASHSHDIIFDDDGYRVGASCEVRKEKYIERKGETEQMLDPEQGLKGSESGTACLEHRVLG